MTAAWSKAMVQGAKRQTVRHLVGSAVGVPVDVCGIDPDQAIDQAQREAADAALGKVGLEHRRSKAVVILATCRLLNLEDAFELPDKKVDWPSGEKSGKLNPKLSL